MKDMHIKLLEEFYANARSTFLKIEEDQLERVISTILRAKKIYVLGIGHSGMFGRILAMKLNHVGLRAYTVFDEINPPFEKGDLFIAISQSGETKTIVTLAERAIKLGGKVLGVTSEAQSTLGKISESVLLIKKNADDVSFDVLSLMGDEKNQNFLGALFGFNIYILFYTIVLMLARRLGETPESIDRRHANLQ
ncbi:MAG: SIS domain-containing protein [Spirochaetota bacterium]